MLETTCICVASQASQASAPIPVENVKNLVVPMQLCRLNSITRKGKHGHAKSSKSKIIILFKRSAAKKSSPPLVVRPVVCVKEINTQESTRSL